MIASQYFLLDKQLRMAFMYDFYTAVEILSPIGILFSVRVHPLIVSSTFIVQKKK